MPDQNRDPIKEAFAKAKQDIFNLSSQIELLKREIQSLKEIVKSTISTPADRQTDTSTHFQVQNSSEKDSNPAQNSQFETFQHINPAQKTIPAHNPAQKQGYYGLKSPISISSIGNEGVPADRQTDRQTDNKHLKEQLNEPLSSNNSLETKPFDRQTNEQPTKNIQEKDNKSLESVSQVLESLDHIRKDVRQKFRRLTMQEMAVFSTIYQLEEDGFTVDYSLLSQKLSLTESSIRDYIQRLAKKGIPLIKNKENNKKILVSISQELKKIASLATIIQLREL
ncbi:MAG: hypothetical protein Q7S27_01550 [Nanoarchaeota archaeon]|nr:hypothetical protein [Nanoarchaeota archaeon]